MTSHLIILHPTSRQTTYEFFLSKPPGSSSCTEATIFLEIGNTRPAGQPHPSLPLAISGLVITKRVWWCCHLQEIPVYPRTRQLSAGGIYCRAAVQAAAERREWKRRCIPDQCSTGGGVRLGRLEACRVYLCSGPHRINGAKHDAER